MHIKIKINETISIVMPNNLKKVKKEKLGEIWSDNRFLTLKILSYLNKFKIHISQLTAKILLKQQCLNQIRHCLMVCIQILHQFVFDQKILKYFNDVQN